MENNTDITAIDNSQDQGPKPSGNPIYQFMKTNNLTDKDEKTFLNEYSDPKKAQELHTFMKDNDLTDKDSASFYDTYLKKKDGTTISGLTKLPSTSQGGNLPDFHKGLALAQKGYAMPNEGGGEQKAEGEYSNFGTNLALQGLTKAADIDIATLKFLRNLKGKLPFTDKAQEIYDENGNLTKYGQGIDNTSDYLGRAIRSFRETQIKDQHLLENQYRLPETTGGQIASGIAGIAPDLALAAMTGGKNLFSGTGTLAAIGNAVTSSFVREQAIAGAAKGYNESDNKSANETFLNTIKEGGKGAGQGALYEIAGFGGNKLGGVIGGALKNTTAKEAVNLGARLATFSLGVPNVESLIKEGRLANQDEVLQNLGVSGAMELFHLAGKAPEALMNKKGAAVTTESNPDIEAKVATHINDVRAGSALNNFMKASPDVIDNLVKSDQTAQHLNLSAMDAVKRAESMPDGEEKSKVLQTAADFTQAADIKHVTDLIANSPDGLTHLAQDLPEDIRDQFMQKAQAIHSTLNPTELQKQAHVDNISQAEDAIKQFEPLANPNNPNVKERLDAQREIDKAKATIDQSTKDFNKTSDEQEQQRQALQDAKLAQQQAQVEPTKPVEEKVASTEFFNRPVNGKIHKTNKTSAESNWNIKSVNGEYIVDEAVGNHGEIIKRPESLVNPLFNGANISSPDDKIFVTKPAKLRKNADGTFDVIEKGEVYYGKEAPKTEAKPTEVKSSPLKDIEGLKGEQKNIRTEASRKIINAVRHIEGFEPYTGPLDGLYSALKEADEYHAYSIFSKLNNLDKAVEVVKNLPSYKGLMAEQAKIETKPAEVKQEVKPTEVKEEVKTYNAKDLKANPDALEEDKDYHTISYPKSFRSLYTNMLGMKSQGHENAKIGDVINIFNKDYVVDGFMENKKNPDETKVHLIRVDENGNLLREQDLTKNERKSGLAKEGEEEAVIPKKTYQEVLKEKQEAEKKLNREIGAEKATVTKEVFRKVNQMGVPEDAEQIALRYLADGGKISDAAIDEAYGTVKGAELNVQRRAVKTEEVKSKDFAGGKESLNDLAHRLWEDSGQKISERDIKNALMTEIGMHNTRLEAGKSYLERYSPEYQAEQHYARIAEQAKEEWENEQKELEDQLRKPLDEQIKGEASEEHINNLIKQYEAETKGENQQPRSEGEGEINKKISSRNGGEEKPTKEAKVEEPEEKTTSIKNKVTAEERANKGLDEIEVAAKRSFPELFEKGKQLVDEGKIDPRQMAIDLAKKPRALSPEESVALLYDRMKIQKEYKKLSADIESEPDGIVKDLMRSNLNQLEKAALINDEAAKKTGYEQGLGLAVRKMIIKEDYSLLNQKARYKAANNGEELSPEIESKLKENVTKLEEAQKKLEEYEQTIKDLQAKKVIDTEAKKAKKTNKTTEDFKKEREDIFKNIKDKWDSASKTNIVTAVPVPYAAQLAAISPEVLKLVRSYAEQGITKLDDIVNDLHENISKQIPDITKRDVKDILAGEYTKKKEAPPIDKEKMKLQSNVNRIKNQIELDKQEILRDKRSTLRKGLDYFQGWRRFGLLSGVPVIGKIGLGGAIRSGITTPGEALIGKGLSMIPGISKISTLSPREGTFNRNAEAKAFAQYVDKASYEDVRQVFKTGRGELENLHDKKLYPSNGWLDFFGNLHAAIKVLPKRAEYFRALEYRTEHALKNGADITDPIVQQELSAKAYADALRSIYMQDNAVTDLYKTAVRKLESLGGIGKGGAEVMKFILPIIKVPTNYVAEESSYILGGFKALFALRKGISKLSPEEADYVMRALKKQTAGVGFLMLGYARPDLVGGYYTGPRKKGDLQSGDLVVAGVHMPHWAMHTPMLEALQFGASIRRAREAAGKSYKQKDLNMFTGIVPSLGAVAKQIPFAEQAEQVTKGLKSTDAFLRYAGGQAQSVLDPQLVKNIAEFTDYSNGQWNKREAKTFMEKLQSGFPGTREQLKIKKQ